MRGKIILIFMLGIWCILSKCLAQEIDLTGEWKGKSARRDTIILLRGGMTAAEIKAYLGRKENFTDTTYYWQFEAPNHLNIEYVIRSNRIIPLEKPDTIKSYSSIEFSQDKKNLKKGIKKLLKKKDKPKWQKEQESNVTYEIRTTREERLSMWDVIQGKWQKQGSNQILITGTILFDGKYIIKVNQAGQLVFILGK